MVKMSWRLCTRARTHLTARTCAQRVPVPPSPSPPPSCIPPPSCYWCWCCLVTFARRQMHELLCRLSSHRSVFSYTRKGWVRFIKNALFNAIVEGKNECWLITSLGLITACRYRDGELARGWVIHVKQDVYRAALFGETHGEGRDSVSFYWRLLKSNPAQRT